MGEITFDLQLFSLHHKVSVKIPINPDLPTLEECLLISHTKLPMDSHEQPCTEWLLNDVSPITKHQSPISTGEDKGNKKKDGTDRIGNERESDVCRLKVTNPIKSEGLQGRRRSKKLWVYDRNLWYWHLGIHQEFSPDPFFSFLMWGERLPMWPGRERNVGREEGKIEKLKWKLPF